MVYSNSKTAKKLTFANLNKFKKEGRKFSMVTCYDYTFAKIIEKSDVDMILVGDSLANVMMGEKSTLAATVDHIVHHCKSVSNGISSKLLIADMPFLAAGVSRELTMKNVQRLMAEGCAHGVKIEGAGERLKDIEMIVDFGVPVVGHLGLMPQKVHAHGGYKVQGKAKVSADEIFEESKKIEKAGASVLVLEMVESGLAKKIAESLTIPVIGIGAGSSVDGQVLVLQDLLGMDADFNPKFLRKYMNLSEDIYKSLNHYHGDVVSGDFPNDSESYIGKPKK